MAAHSLGGKLCLCQVSPLLGSGRGMWMTTKQSGHSPVTDPGDGVQV